MKNTLFEPAPNKFIRPHVQPYKECVKIKENLAQTHSINSPLLVSPKIKLKPKDFRKVCESPLLPSVLSKNEMKKNYSIHNNSKLPKHKKQEYSLDIRCLDSSKMSINDNYNSSIKKNSDINEDFKLSPLDVCKTIDPREKMINIIDTQKKGFYLEKNDQRNTIKLIPKKIDKEKEKINPKMQFLKKYLNDNEIKFTPKNVYYFPSIKSKKDESLKVMQTEKKEKSFTKAKSRFLTPNHQHKQKSQIDSFLMKSDSSFTDDQNINNISTYNKVDESYLADESIKTSNLKKNLKINLPSQPINSNYMSKEKSESFKKKMSLFDNLNSFPAKKKTSVIEICPVANSREIVKINSKIPKKSFSKYLNEISTNDEIVSLKKTVDMTPLLIINHKIDSIENILEDSFFENKNGNFSKNEKADSNLEFPSPPSTHPISPQKKGLSENCFFDKLVPDFFAEEEEDLPNSENKKENSTILEERKMMVQPNFNYSELSPRFESISRALKPYYNVYNNSKHESPNLVKINHYGTSEFDLIVNRKQSTEINPLNSLRSSMEEEER